jgi:hypothetical protein
VEKKNHNLLKFCKKLTIGKCVVTFEFDILNANKEEWNDRECGVGGKVDQ